MRCPLFRRLAAASITLLVMLTAGPVIAASSVDDQPYKVLVFSKTAAFRHTSIPNGLTAIRRFKRPSSRSRMPPPGLSLCRGFAAVEKAYSEGTEAR